MESAMEEKTNSNRGLKRLVRRCRNAFQRPENTDYYDAEDYQHAERKFVKHCLLNEIDLPN